MAEGPNAPRQGFLRWLENPLAWDLPHRCSLIALIALFFATWTDLIARYLLFRPEVAAYISRPVLLWLAHTEEIIIVGWIAIAAAGLLVRPAGYGVSALSYVLAFLYSAHVLIIGYCIGPFTAIYSGAVLMAGLIIGTLLLEPRPALLALSGLILGDIGMTIAEQMRIVPYAPLLIQAPFRDGHLSRWWVVTFGGFDFTLLVSMFLLGLLLMRRWHEREDQLAEANRFLARFLSPQVARMVKELGMSSVVQKSRSQLTAIECDLRGFTAFSESVAPEEVIDLLEKYYAAIGEAVSEQGGTIKDYSGDGVLILVGAPTPYPDHARRAMLIALRLQERVREILSQWRNLGLDISVGIGMASGYVTVGAIGGAERMEYVAVGPAVNLAARLCEHARSESILVDQRTISLLGNGSDSFHFDQLDAAELKGFSRPVRIFSLTANGVNSAAAN